jgi:hypothetical protein
MPFVSHPHVILVQNHQRGGQFVNRTDNIALCVRERGDITGHQRRRFQRDPLRVCGTEYDDTSDLQVTLGYKPQSCSVVLQVSSCASPSLSP